MREFFTISQESVFESTEKRSKFISYSFRVHTSQNVKDRLNAIRSEHWDAKHHVYAYSLVDSDAVKFSDDGEPGGTGGMPVLNAIQSENLKDTLVVVVRYFGGILLGTAGLRAAYKSGAENVLKLSGKQLFKLCKKAELKVDYSKYGLILNCVEESEGKVLESRFEDSVKMTVAVPVENFDRFNKKIFQFCGDTPMNDVLEEYIHI